MRRGHKWKAYRSKKGRKTGGILVESKQERYKWRRRRTTSRRRQIHKIVSFITFYFIQLNEKGQQHIWEREGEAPSWTPTMKKVLGREYFTSHNNKGKREVFIWSQHAPIFILSLPLLSLSALLVISPLEHFFFLSHSTTIYRWYCPAWILSTFSRFLSLSLFHSCFPRPLFFWLSCPVSLLAPILLHSSHNY